MKSYKLIAGRHTDGNGVSYQAVPGKTVIVKSKSDLIRIFPNKFELAHTHEVDEAVNGEDQGSEDNDDSNALGDDVTDLFPVAKEADLKVYKNGSKYFVENPDNAGTAVNEKPLAKGKVEGFVNDYLEDEE